MKAEKDLWFGEILRLLRELRSLAMTALLFLTILPLTFAEEETKKSPLQNVGGLLFDVDEGVDVEKGPGGSVYVKSNREAMQKKFDTIDDRFKDLEARVQKLEKEISGETAESEKGNSFVSTKKVLSSE